jgi:hypothetical protein
VPNTRSRRLGVALAATLAVCACRGPDDLSLGEAPLPPSSSERFLSPGGNDQNDGTRERPWKTFAHALPALGPGSTLTLLASAAPYEDATTGTLNVRCADASADSTVPGAVLASSGLQTAGMAITVRADPGAERQAFLRGSGRAPPLSIDTCHDWTISGLRVESQDLADPSLSTDDGAVVVVDGPSSGLTLEGLLVRKPNRYQPSPLVRVGDGATGVTIDECELYDFHATAFEVRRAGSISFLRNYINSRGTRDPADATVPSEDPTRGDWGVLLEETHDVVIANNVVEDVADGIGVVGRGPGVTAPPLNAPPGNNLLLGNVVYKPAILGFRLDSRCGGAPACDGSHEVYRVELGNDVVVGGALGVSDAGSVGTRIHELTIIDAARGESISKEPQNNALQATSQTFNTLVTGYQSVAFYQAGQMTWGFDHCAASVGYDPATAYEPDDPARVTNKVMAAPLGACLVYLPADSLLRNMGGAGNDVGANVVYRYDETGQPTTTPLWTPGFPCGAIVAGVNDDPATNCVGVNAAGRLNVSPKGGSGTCPLPIP